MPLRAAARSRPTTPPVCAPEPDTLMPTTWWSCDLGWVGGCLHGRVRFKRKLATLLHGIHRRVRSGSGSARWTPRGGAVGNSDIGSASVLGLLGLCAPVKVRLERR